jgi:hypothetical protein
MARASSDRFSAALRFRACDRPEHGVVADSSSTSAQQIGGGDITSRPVRASAGNARISCRSCWRRGGQFVAVGQLQRGGASGSHAARVLVHLFQRLGTQPALGLVVDPFEREIILRLGDHAQIGQRIADFGALVEAEAADDAVIEADLDEAVFELAGLVLGAHEDRHADRAAPFAFQPFDLLAHPARFLGRVPHADHAHLVAAVHLGPQGLVVALAVGPDQARRSTQNMRGGAVVLFQPDHFRARKILFEPQDIGHFCPAP